MDLPDLLSKNIFYSKVIPFFERAKLDLLEVVGDDKKWYSFLTKLRLVFIDNSEVDRSSHLYLSNSIDDNLFLSDSEPQHKYHGFKSDAIHDGYVYYSVLDLLRWVFIEELLARARPKHITEFVKQLLESNYRFIDNREEKDYISFTVPNLQFSSENLVFAISAYNINVVIPKTEKLSADRIKDETADCKKVIFTNRKDISDYLGFDQILDHSHLVFYFAAANFASGLYLYQRVLGKDFKDIFKIIDILRTTGYNEVYDLKKQLVNLNLSDGKAFEDYIEKFLSLCLGSCFKNFVIKKQVPNEGRLRVRDFIIVNNSTTSPFLLSLKKKGVDFLLFDAKNYENELNTGDIDTFREYIRENLYFGNFGVILSRKGVSTNCQESIFRNLLKDRMKILVLDENDLLMVLRYVDSGKNAIDILENKFTELVLKM